MSTSRLAVEEVLALVDWAGGGLLGLGFRRLMKVRGAQRRPIMNEREKLRVARVERKRPRMRSEKDLIRRYCWVGFMEEVVAVDLRASRAARLRGRTRSARIDM